jgi:hypothetical protein
MMMNRPVPVYVFVVRLLHLLFLLVGLYGEVTGSCSCKVSNYLGLVVSVLAIGPSVHGFKPGRGDGFLKAIKIRITSFFREEVKPSAPCRKILRHVTDL